MKRLSFWVDGAAVSFRGAFGDSRKPSPEALAWRGTVQWAFQDAARRAGDFPWDGGYVGPVLLLIEAYGSAADWDNLGKEISDALEGHAYRNDRQVCNGRVKFPMRRLTPKGVVARPLADETPGLLITIVLANG